ncbi:MAG: polyhydroxyalkanoate synthesis repressor PhaR [Burkholderiales bacterium]
MSTAKRVIKKYPNRRLYDTATSSYITLADVKNLVLDSENFHVLDAKTNEDITRSILLQIILEEESGGVPMFTSEMLAQTIRFYGNAMQGMMGAYLEKSIGSFIEVQAKLQEQARTMYGGTAPQMNTDLWKQFMQSQGPAVQGLMGNYMEQSANMFLQMQDQIQKQTRNLFGGFGVPESNQDASESKAPRPKPKTEKGKY